MDELTAALDDLAAEVLTPLFGPALLERLRPLLAAQNRLAAEVARTVRECEVSGAAEVDGLKTMPSWLRGHGHLSDFRPCRLALDALGAPSAVAPELCGPGRAVLDGPHPP